MQKYSVLTASESLEEDSDVSTAVSCENAKGLILAMSWVKIVRALHPLISCGNLVPLEGDEFGDSRIRGC
jgi:hypothetical protein